MLVLSRKVGEEIVIGGDIRVSVVEVGPGRVKLGVSAPKHVRVDRAEIHEQKQVEVAKPLVVQQPPLVNRIAGLPLPRPVLKPR